jgi:hypothetical protein
MIKTIKAVLIEGPYRFEKDCAEHYRGVPIWNVFPPRNETLAAKLAWADRVWNDGVKIKEKVNGPF